MIEQFSEAELDQIKKEIRLSADRRRSTVNSEVKAKAVAAGVRQWEIADFLGVSEMTFSRMLRHPLKREEKDRVLTAIKTIQMKRIR